MASSKKRPAIGGSYTGKTAQDNSSTAPKGFVKQSYEADHLNKLVTENTPPPIIANNLGRTENTMRSEAKPKAYIAPAVRSPALCGPAYDKDERRCSIKRSPKLKKMATGSVLDSGRALNLTKDEHVCHKAQTDGMFVTGFQ